MNEFKLHGEILVLFLIHYALFSFELIQIHEDGHMTLRSLTSCALTESGRGQSGTPPIATARACLQSLEWRRQERT